MGQPDFSIQECGQYGGKLDDIPEPHVWFFGSGKATRKRKVKVHIMRYYGIGPHYFLSFDQEKDFIWDPSEDKWTVPWGHQRTFTETDFEREDGLAVNKEHDSYAVVKNLAVRMLEKYYPDHEVVWEDYCEHFEKEGD